MLYESADGGLRATRGRTFGDARPGELVVPNMTLPNYVIDLVAPGQAFYARQGWVPDPEHPPAEGDHHLFLRFRVPGE